MFHYTWRAHQINFRGVVNSLMASPYSQIWMTFVLEIRWGLRITDPISNTNCKTRQGMKFPSAKMRYHENSFGLSVVKLQLVICLHGHGWFRVHFQWSYDIKWPVRRREILALGTELYAALGALLTPWSLSVPPARRSWIPPPVLPFWRSLVLTWPPDHPPISTSVECPPKPPLACHPMGS